MSITHLDMDGIKALTFDRHELDPIIFDIETGPSNDHLLMESLKPDFTAPSNWKDPAKIEKYIAEKEEEWLEKAALNPLTGGIVAFGFRFKGTNYSILGGGSPPPEVHILQGIKELAQRAGQRPWVGHNIKDFDLPFICRRMLKWGFSLPLGWRNDRWWSSFFEDTKEMWSFGKFGDFISLDRLAKFFGQEGKLGKSGKDFSMRLLVDPDEAYAYVAKDLELSEYVYKRLKNADQ